MMVMVSEAGTLGTLILKMCQCKIMEENLTVRILTGGSDEISFGDIGRV